jgi:hypothetical protein
MKTLDCGCIHERHACGVMHCQKRCDDHRAQADSLRGERQTVHVAKGGFLGNAEAVREMARILGPLPPTLSQQPALEIGCGCSLYAPAIMQAGYRYTGLEPDEWAADWTENAFCVNVLREKFPTVSLQDHYFGLVVAAKVLEEIADPPDLTLKAVSKMLMGGAWLFLVVRDAAVTPYATGNWFFSWDTLENIIREAGFGIVKHGRTEDSFYVAARLR